MSSVLVDSNVLLDVLGEDGAWSAWSARALSSAAESARLVINPIVYAEVSTRYSRIEDLDTALPIELFVREPLPFERPFWRRRS